MWLVVGELKIGPGWATMQAGVKAWAVSAAQFKLAKWGQTGAIFCAGTRKTEKLENSLLLPL